MDNAQLVDLLGLGYRCRVQDEPSKYKGRVLFGTYHLLTIFMFMLILFLYSLEEMWYETDKFVLIGKYSIFNN